MSERVVITGLGILTCNAKGKDEFWQALKDGRHGFRPATIFETDPFRTNIVGEISDFDATVFLGPKGLRTMDRATRLVVSAGRLAVKDSGLVINDDNTDDIGVAVGTTLGSITSIAQFDEITLKEGPRYTNPALFPNTVINSPASHISIWENIQGFNTTISTGFTASMDALNYAYDFIQTDQSKVIYAGGVEEMSYYTFYGFYALEYLSGSKEGQEYINCPFDKRRNGATFGEGACIMAFEDYDHALKRGANILGEVAGFGYAFDPYRLDRYNPRGICVKEAIKDALDNAGMSTDDIDYICSNGNSTRAVDKIETRAIKEVFGERAYKIPVSTIKSMVGECYSVSGAFGVAAGLGVLNQGFIPPTIGYKEKDADCDLDYVPNKARNAKADNILIINFGPGPACCMILKRYKR